MAKPAADIFPREIVEEIARETAHFSAAPTAFFTAWRQGVLLAGVRFFGNGTRADLDQAVTKSDLRPNVRLIDAAIGPMSTHEKVFIAALVSFYDTEDGGRLLKRVGVKGLADLYGLDLKRRGVIAALILNYCGW